MLSASRNTGAPGSTQANGSEDLEVGPARLGVCRQILGASAGSESTHAHSRLRVQWTL